MDLGAVANQQGLAVRAILGIGDLFVSGVTTVGLALPDSLQRLFFR